MTWSTVLGVAGAVIGSFVGAPQIGFMVGAALGGYIDTTSQKIEGPRLSDLHVQGSEYGRPIPIVYGTAAVQGNVIWQTDLVEVESSSGGKGEPEVSNFTYFANFAVAICEGEVELGRIWAGPDKRLIYDGETLEGGGNITFYSGSETQLPDPLMEAHEGAGNVPAYRGTAYVVFENFPVAKDGNRIPFLTIEVGKVSETPVDVGTVWTEGPIYVDESRGTFSISYSGTSDGVITRTLDDHSFVSNHLWSIAPGMSFSFYDYDNSAVIAGTSGSLRRLDLSSGDEALIDVISGSWPSLPALSEYTVAGGIHHNGSYYTLLNSSLANKRAISVLDPALFDTDPAADCYLGDVGSGLPELATFCGRRQEGDAYILGATKAGTVLKFPLVNLFSSVSCGACVANADYIAVDPNTGFVWAIKFNSSTLEVTCNDPVTQAQIYSGSIAHTAFSLSGGPRLSAPFVFDPVADRVYVSAEKWLGIDYIFSFVASVPAHAGNIEGRYHGTNSLRAAFFNPLTEVVWFERDFAWMNQPILGDFENIALNGTELDDYPDSSYRIGDRGFTVGGDLLSDVVADLCERAGLQASEYDVSALTSDTVDGYVIANQVAVRDAIRALMTPYRFDAVESNGQVKFVKRGGAIAVTIPDEDLGAYEAGTEPPEDFVTVRRMENELPRTLTVRYLNRNADYTQLVRQAKRLVGGSGEEASIEVPLVMTDTMAQEVAETALHNQWVARRGFKFSLPRKYAYLEPTDVISAKGQRMLITNMKQRDGVYDIEAVYDDYSYVPNVVVTETPVSGKVVYVPSETILELA